MPSKKKNPERRDWNQIVSKVLNGKGGRAKKIVFPSVGSAQVTRVRLLRTYNTGKKPVLSAVTVGSTLFLRRV